MNPKCPGCNGRQFPPDWRACKIHGSMSLDRFDGVTRVVHINEDEGYEVYIGRPRRGESEELSLGNPFPIVPGTPRAQVIAQFREYFYDRLGKDPAFKARVEACRGKRLGCFCAPKPCHGDVIAAYLNESEESHVYGHLRSP